MGGYQIGLSASASSGASAGQGDIVFPSKATDWLPWIVVGAVALVVVIIWKR